MIELTRLNGERMVINSDLIRYIEASPDTVITLITGDKIVITESTAELIERIIAFRSRLLQHAFPGGAVIVGPSQSISASAASTAHAAATASSLTNSQPVQDESWRRRQETD